MYLSHRHVSAVAAERYDRARRVSPPNRVEGRRSVERPIRLIRRGDDSEQFKAA